MLRRLKDRGFEDLVGHTFTNVEQIGYDQFPNVPRSGPKNRYPYRAFDSDVILFEGPKSFALGYHSDCCAQCDVKQIDGDLKDLVGTPILSAEEVDSDEPPPGDDWDTSDSWTWTFYHIRTIKGTVTIQFFGSSNGYYSETASFEEVEIDYA